jgi:hypothetical protein
VPAPSLRSWSAHPRDGWTFWWRWVLATNLGWFPGIALGTWLTRPIADSWPLGAAMTSAALAALCFGGAQAYALRAVLARPGAWWLATVIAWPLGIGAAHLLLAASGGVAHGLLEMMLVAAIAGGCVGLPQARLLAPLTPRSRWWPWVSSVSWGLLFPGALAGLALIWWSRPRAAEADTR